MNICEKLADSFVQNHIIDTKDKELYVYGLHQAMVLLLNVATTIVIGVLFGMVLQSIIFMFSYMFLRVFAGGFHADTELQCYLFSTVLTALVLLWMRLMPWSNQTVVFLLIPSIVVFYLLAPVEDKNKPLDNEEILVYKKRTRLILMIEIITIILMMILNLPFILSQPIVIGIATLAMMIVLGKIKNCLQNKKGD